MEHVRHETTLPLNPSAALLKQLREMKRFAARVEVESSGARAQWLEALDSLLRSVRGWMQRAVDEGLARIDVASVHVPDDAVGPYDAPALRIALPGSRIVWMRPVGTLCIGARGIVDLACGSSRALLLLNRTGVWKIRGGPPAPVLSPLDENAFARALAELIL
jgi:hypothetical protein